MSDLSYSALITVRGTRFVAVRVGGELCLAKDEPLSRPLTVHFGAIGQQAEWARRHGHSPRRVAIAVGCLAWLERGDLLANLPLHTEYHYQVRRSKGRYQPEQAQVHVWPLSWDFFPVIKRGVERWI